MAAAAADTIDVKSYAKYSTLLVTSPATHVLQVELNRPKQRNAMNRAFWAEIRTVIDQIGADRSVRAVILSAVGPIFTAGLDCTYLVSRPFVFVLCDVTDLTCAGLVWFGWWFSRSLSLFVVNSVTDHGDVFFSGGEANATQTDSARKALQLRKAVTEYQNAFNGFEKIPQPIIAAVHGPCVGGGVDMICAADIRICSSAPDTWFCIKEVDIAMTADVGTFPRLIKITGNDSAVRELAFTGRNLSANDALSIGLVSSVVAGDRTKLMAHALNMAKTIATKSPLAIAGIKHVMNYGRDHSTADALEYVATWNMSQLQTADVMTAAGAFIAKQTPIFSKL